MWVATSWWGEKNVSPENSPVEDHCSKWHLRLSLSRCRSTAVCYFCTFVPRCHEGVGPQSKVVKSAPRGRKGSVSAACGLLPLDGKLSIHPRVLRQTKDTLIWVSYLSGVVNLCVYRRLFSLARYGQVVVLITWMSIKFSNWLFQRVNWDRFARKFAAFCTKKTANFILLVSIPLHQRWQLF